MAIQPSTYHWSDNCLSSSTKSAGMEVTRGNGNIHWTSHMMMMMLQPSPGSSCSNS